MIRLFWDKGFDYHPNAVQRAVLALCNGLSESEAKIMRGRDCDYEVHFPDNSAIFKLQSVTSRQVDHEMPLTFAIKFCQGDSVWHDRYEDASITHIARMMLTYREGGFPTGQDWKSSSCERNPLYERLECKEVPLEEPERSAMEAGDVTRVFWDEQLKAWDKFGPSNKTVENIAKALGKAMEEPNIYVTSGVDTDFEFCFDDNWAKFGVSNVEEVGGGLFFDLCLLIGKNKWEKEYEDVSLEDVQNEWSGYNSVVLPTGVTWVSMLCPRVHQRTKDGSKFSIYRGYSVTDLYWGDYKKGTKDEVVFEIAKTIGIGLGEQVTYVTRLSDIVYRVSFDDNNAFFEISHINAGESSGRASFFVCLCQGDARWSKDYDDVLLSAVQDELTGYLRRSFPNGVIWRKSTCTPGKATVYPREAQLITDSSGATRGSSGTTVVKGDIKQLRVVALKHDGKVIAYRFKTDIGVFDMRKEVAAQYGLVEFRTEKFIFLKSVNGMLMSESEQKRRKFVPDVSENREDCEKLIKCLFGQ